MEINRASIKYLLEDTNIEIDCVENGQVGIELFSANTEKYDLIFMDIPMPLADGFSATRAIREIGNAKAKPIPIVAMTANAFREDMEKCRAAGMDDHIAKPIDLELLLSKVHKYLR